MLELDNLPRLLPEEAPERIPPEPGIYFWFRKVDGELVYIGIAVGAGGLRKRIVGQHLNPGYVECRREKWTARDAFQAGNPVVRIGRDGKPRQGIDKSAFRKAIGRQLQVPPGQGTVDYIHRHFFLRFRVCHDIEEVKRMEKELIALHEPVFNTAHAGR